MNLDPLGINGGGKNLDPLGLGTAPPMEDTSLFGKVKRFAARNFGDGTVPGVEMGLPPEESKGLAQGMLSTATGAGSWIPGGLSMFSFDKRTPVERAKTAKDIQEQLTYSPSTPSGQAVAGALASPFTAMAEAGERGGQYLDEKGYPILGMGSRILGEAAPFMLPLAYKGVQKGVVRPIRQGIKEIGGMEGVLEAAPEVRTARNIPPETMPTRGVPVGQPYGETTVQRPVKPDFDPLRLTAPEERKLLGEEKGFELVDRATEQKRWIPDQEAEAAGFPATERGLDPLGIYEKPVKQKKSRFTAYDGMIDMAAANHRVDPSLVRAVVNAESRFRNNAVSPKGASGLMQLMPKTAKYLGVTDLFDPAQNINAGTKYLSDLLKRYKGDETQALAAYNWGMGRVDNLIKRGKFSIENLPRETRNYVNKILKGREQPAGVVKIPPEPTKTGQIQEIAPKAIQEVKGTEAPPIDENLRTRTLSDEWQKRMATAKIEGIDVDPAEVMRQLETDYNAGKLGQEGEGVRAGSLKEGETVTINGEDFTHQGFDKAGKVILKDGETMHVDRFENIPVKEKPATIAGESAPAGIAKSIEAKAIEAGWIKSGFDKVAEYDPTTMKAQAQGSADVINSGLDRTRQILRNEEQLPQGLRGISLIKAVEEYAKTVKDPVLKAELSYEMANSVHASEVSEAGQLLSVTRGRELDSFSAKAAEIKKAREAQAGVDGKKVSSVKKSLKEEVSQVNLPKEDLFWSKFLKSVEC